MPSCLLSACIRHELFAMEEADFLLPASCHFLHHSPFSLEQQERAGGRVGRRLEMVISPCR